MVLICSVILQNHVINELRDFLDKNLSRSTIILPSLLAINTVLVEIQWL